MPQDGNGNKPLHVCAYRYIYTYFIPVSLYRVFLYSCLLFSSYFHCIHGRFTEVGALTVGGQGLKILFGVSKACRDDVMLAIMQNISFGILLPLG